MLAIVPYGKESFSLPAQFVDSVDLKDGLLKNRVCTLRFLVVESYFSCNTTYTVWGCTRPSSRKVLEVGWFRFYEMVLHCTSPVDKKSILIFNTLFSSVSFCKISFFIICKLFQKALYQALRFCGFCCSGSVTLIKKGEHNRKLWIFLVFQDRDTQNFQKLFLYLPEVHSWFTYGLKSIRFWWYFTTFHENEEGVLLKIWL